MNKTTKWLVGLVAALVIINVALVATIWLKKDEVKTGPLRGDARDYLVKSLDMTAAQVKAFDSLREEHFEVMKTRKNVMRFVKDRLFSLLGDTSKNEIKDSIARYLLEKIGEQQEQIDKETFNHFSGLRSLLTTPQQKKFDTTIQQVLRTMGPRGGDMPPPLRKGFERGRPEGPPPPGEGGDGPPPHGGEPE